MDEVVVCLFDGPRIQVKLVKVPTEEGEPEMFHVRWKSISGKQFVNVLKRPTNYRDASELYFEMTTTCLKSNKSNEI